MFSAQLVTGALLLAVVVTVPLVHTQDPGQSDLLAGRIIEYVVPTPEEGPQLILSFATYLGGSGSDDCDAVAVDHSGSIYLACHSNSKEFPLATSTPEMDRESRWKSSTSWEHRYDAFVVKLDPTGSRVLYTTSLGGSRWEGAFVITVDASGNVYVAGATASPDFPTTKGALQTSFGGDYDVFVAKLDASGAVVYCTYLGGSGEEYAGDIVADEARNVHVVGTTHSKDFPTTEGGLQRALAGKQDAFVAKLDAGGSRLLYSTYLGGQEKEEGWSIALDGEGNIYVTGNTRSKDFLVTPGALQQSLAGGADVFISKLDARASNLLYSTYLGGSADEYIRDDNGNFALDAQGHLYVAGTTESHNFPTTPKAFQRNFAGGEADAFLAKLDLANSRLVYSTYLGGSRRDGATGVGVDAQGRAVVIGETDSPNFPTRKAVQTAFAGGKADAFLVELSQDGSTLLYSTYLGGSGRESPEDIAVHATGNVYVSGLGNSSDFPTVAAIHAAYAGGRYDIILARFDLRPPGLRASKIVFESERDGHREVYAMDPDGANQQRLTHTPGTGEGSWSPRWSPDRTRIVFTSTREGDLNQVYVMDADGSNVQRLTHTPGKESANPAWSPDGKRVAFESDRDGNYDIYVMDTDGSNVQRLTHTKGRNKNSENPEWSPDGKRIAFESNRDGNYEIYVMDTDGSNVQRLTHRPGSGVGTWRPRWSPDGKRIAFSSGPKRNYEISTINADGSDLRRLTHNSGKASDNRHPDWSPDGGKIVFQFTLDGKSKNWYDNFEMYVMDADGSNVQRLTFNQAWDGHPDW